LVLDIIDEWIEIILHWGVVIVRRSLRFMASRFGSVDVNWIHEIMGMWWLKDGLVVHERINHLEYAFVEQPRQIGC